MTLHTLALAPDSDDALVIDGATLTSTKQGWTLTFEHILVAVHFALPDTLPHVDGSPFRTAAGVELAIAVDAFGAVHAVDPSAGTRLFSLPARGKPIAAAASTTSPEFALAVEGRIVVWRNGKEDEIIAAASVLAFDGEGLVYVDGSALVVGGSSAPLALAGRVCDLAKFPGNTWVVATSLGVYGPFGTIHDGPARRLVRDRDDGLMVVQRSDTMLDVLRSGWESFKRIHYTDRTITGFELLPGHVLVVALDGGRTNRIALDSGTITSTGKGAWKVEVEAGSAKSYLTGRIGHRRGVVAIIPVATAAALCVWTLLHAHKTPVPEPPRLRPVASAVALPTSTCKAGCELDRFDKLVAACAGAPADLRCADTAKEARDAFGVRRCEIAKMELQVLSLRVRGHADAPVPQPVVEAVDQAIDGLSSCAVAMTASYGLVGLRDDGRAPLGLAAPSQVERPRALAVDRSGDVYVATEARAPQRCELYRRDPTVDTQWKTILTATGCSSAHVFARSENDVYFATGPAVSFWNGTAWADVPRLASDVLALAGTFKGNDVLALTEAGIQQLHDGTWTSVSTRPFADLFAGTVLTARAKDNAFFARLADDTWAPLHVEKSPRVVLELKPNALFAGGDDGLSRYDGAIWRSVPLPGAPVAYLASNDHDVWVITEVE